MYVSQVKLRVRYAETDRMGYCYYGNYAAYFEVARVEALRGLGITYRSLEDSGILLPVLDFQVKYLKPAYYDDELVIKTTISEMPSARIRFTYETFNINEERLNFAETTLVFVNTTANKPVKAPEELINALKTHLSNE